MRDDVRLEVGARVEWRTRGGGAWSNAVTRGRVVRLTASNVWLQAESGHGEPERRKLEADGTAWGVRTLTAHDLALEAWEKAKPRTALLHASLGMGGRVDTDDARPTLATTWLEGTVRKGPAAFDTIAAEAAMLAAWLRAKPQP